MRNLIFIIVCMIMVSFNIQQKKQKVIFFGDSITQAGVNKDGYITKMDSMLKVKGKGNTFELVGAGIGGNKVYDLYLRMEEDVLSKNPDIVYIWVGVNDVWHKESFGTGTDADKFVRFYEAIISKLKAKNIRTILVTPGAIGEKTDFSNQLDGDLNKYSNLIREIAKKTGCELVDLRKEFLAYNKEHNTENKESGILTNDRVHLNPVGNEFVAKKMLEPLLK